MGHDNTNYLVEHVLDQLDLVGNLGTTENSKEGAFGRLESLGEEFELLLDEETGGTLGQLDTDHAGVGAVGSAERVVHVDITETGEAGAEFRNLGRVSLGLRAVLVLDRTLFLDVEAKVLEEDEGARGGVGNGLLDFGTDRVVQEDDRLANLLLELGSDWLEGVFFDHLSVRTAEVGHQGDSGSTWK